MSEIMLEAVLRMPIELWNNGPIDQMQRHSRYIQAADEIARLRAQVSELTKERDALKQQLSLLGPVCAKIVLPTDPDYMLMMTKADYDKSLEQARQETAREIIQYIINQGTVPDAIGSTHIYDIQDCDLDELRDKYGIKEDV
ncbi:hypothetical protein F6V30_14060 [Oryzomonas sagensis]|uniref:Uncharacterized protein n=1 Tax=Oryzomonas sagensis TaxID=2603857 RepID=A0ABQ6TLM7_9BACT|nr:hypothetical protein [Oryzomonas sagensis]KAB0668958.1 hypothetical protein F6V30_14060 [Oryzomonas sagensis]